MCDTMKPYKLTIIKQHIDSADRSEDGHRLTHSMLALVKLKFNEQVEKQNNEV